MGVLLPLLEQVVSKTEEPEDEQETNDLVGPELTSSRNAQGLLIPLGKSSGEDSGDVLLEVIMEGFLRMAGATMAGEILSDSRSDRVVKEPLGMLLRPS